MTSATMEAHHKGMDADLPLPLPPLAPLTDWLRPVTLIGRFVRLEPLREGHAAGIFQHADTETVALLARGGPAEHSVQGWAGYISRLNAVPGRVNWAVVLAEPIPEQVAGRVSFSTLNHADRWAEIGTMLTPPFQGGTCNPEAKLLLMERAFSVLGAGRVHFRVDARNARSRAAMHKLGATEEGTLRRYQTRPDGSARDSVMFSVLPEEWPVVRAGLLARLDAYA
ncbi:GNAT family N-acetyltransferase [Deinococcus sp.]|uniref:GNAT family N-acetyltransferase n=1 Tax=Deinococcus sp. TaxID=47478 RepID=UPI003C7AB8BC